MSTRRLVSRNAQRGQSIVEYTVVLVFGFLVLLQGDDILAKLQDVMHDNYKGYSYAVSLSDIPDYDSIYEYGMSTPEAQAAQADLNQLMDTFDTITGQGFPTLDDFGSIVGNQIPTSPGDILQGAISFF